jgi:hypothetical protein
MRCRWIAVASLFATMSLSAQTTFTLQEEDDSLVSAALRSDRGYTNGTRMLWNWVPAEKSRLDRAASILCRHDSDCERMVTAGIGQNMYTPENLARSTVIVGDRPYGGWLYGTLMFDTTRQSTINDHVELYAGVIGRDSFAEEAQKFVHEHVVTTAQDPKGWGNQIGEWAALLASYERRVKIVSLTRGADHIEWLDVTPALGGSVGNVFDNANASATVRLGFNLPGRYIAPIKAVPLALHTPLPVIQERGAARQAERETRKEAGEQAGTQAAPHDWDAYVYVIANASYAARSIFIDTEDDKYRIRRLPWGREHRAGVSFRIHHFRTAYQYTWRSSEFRPLVHFLGPSRPHSYGMVMVSIGPNT